MTQVQFNSGRKTYLSVDGIGGLHITQTASPPSPVYTVPPETKSGLLSLFLGFAPHGNYVESSKFTASRNPMGSFRYSFAFYIKPKIGAYGRYRSAKTLK